MRVKLHINIYDFRTLLISVFTSKLRSENIDGKKSSFSVPDIVNVETKSFTNPVIGEEQDTKIQIPKGFIWKLA